MTEHRVPDMEEIEISKRLSARFDPGEVKTRTGRGKQEFSYVDARAVMQRLDDVVGAENWSTTFRLLRLDPPAVECQLSVYGVAKSDCGEASEEDEPMKAAYSDAFKRAAVHWGVGRYLYAGTTPPTGQISSVSTALATSQQVGTLYELAGTLGMDREMFNARVARNFAGRRPEKLTRSEAIALAEKLRREAAKPNE